MKNEITKKAIDHFGLTTIPDKAGYMLTNGTLLNFRDEKGHVHHKEIFVSGCETEDFMSLGHIRIRHKGNKNMYPSVKHLVLHIAVKPTQSQQKAIINIMKNDNVPVMLDLGIRDNKRSSAYFEYPDLMGIMKAINNHFE